MQYESQDRAVGIRTIRLNSSLELLGELDQWMNGDFRYIENIPPGLTQTEVTKVFEYWLFEDMPTEKKDVIRDLDHLLHGGNTR